MALIDIKWTPTTRDLRIFGVIWLVFFGLVAAWMLSRGSTMIWVSAAAGVAVTGGVLGMLLPELLRPVYLLWMTLAFPIGWLVSHLILGFVYFGLLLPIGLLLRMVGHDPLRRKDKGVAETHWCERHTETESSRYFRQF